MIIGEKLQWAKQFLFAIHCQDVSVAYFNYLFWIDLVVLDHTMSG